MRTWAFPTTTASGNVRTTQKAFSEAYLWNSESSRWRRSKRNGTRTAIPKRLTSLFSAGFWYKDQLDDALTTIVNAGFLNDFGAVEGETIEQYIARWAEVICGWEIRDLAVQDGGTMGSYPASRVTWLTGENEDTRRWDALMVFTDQYTYFYGFDIQADFAEEFTEDIEDVYSRLELVYPEE